MEDHRKDRIAKMKHEGSKLARRLIKGVLEGNNYEITGGSPSDLILEHCHSILEVLRQMNDSGTDMSLLSQDVFRTGDEVRVLMPLSFSLLSGHIDEKGRIVRITTGRPGGRPDVYYVQFAGGEIDALWKEDLVHWEGSSRVEKILDDITATTITGKER